MKKLLSIISAFAITSTTGISCCNIVSCAKTTKTELPVPIDYDFKLRENTNIAIKITGESAKLFTRNQQNIRQEINMTLIIKKERNEYKVSSLQTSNHLNDDKLDIKAVLESLNDKIKPNKKFKKAKQKIIDKFETLKVKTSDLYVTLLLESYERTFKENPQDKPYIKLQDDLYYKVGEFDADRKPGYITKDGKNYYKYALELSDYIIDYEFNGQGLSDDFISELKKNYTFEYIENWNDYSYKLRLDINKYWNLNSLYEDVSLRYLEFNFFISLT